MITLQDLCTHLDALLQPALFSDGCPNGLQVEGKESITKLATAVSASLATIEAAVEAKADALIVHHGMFWSGDNYVITGSKRKKLELLLKSGISLLAYHLPLDAHQVYGNNWRAAIELGWENLEPFGIYKGIPIGVKGSFAAISRKDFTEELQNYYDHSAHVAAGGPEMVKSAALISGGAYRSLTEAALAGVDCFITGNFDEPAWHQAFEEKINFFALGHSNTEKIGPKSLGQHLSEQFLLPCDFIDVMNPF
jgi:dinuclear metal center YbgI/SA1388 family protein